MNMTDFAHNAQPSSMRMPPYHTTHPFAETPNYKTLKTGFYDLKILKAESRQSRSDSPYTSLTVQVVEGADIGTTVKVPCFRYELGTTKIKPFGLGVLGPLMYQPDLLEGENVVIEAHIYTHFTARRGYKGSDISILRPLDTGNLTIIPAVGAAWNPPAGLYSLRYCSGAAVRSGPQRGAYQITFDVHEGPYQGYQVAQLYPGGASEANASLDLLGIKKFGKHRSIKQVVVAQVAYLAQRHKSTALAKVAPYENDPFGEVPGEF